MTDPQHPIPNSSYSYTSLRYWCPTCQRQFNSLSLENIPTSQAQCPRCDTPSNLVPPQNEEPDIQILPQSSSDHNGPEHNGRNGYLYFTETLMGPAGRVLVRTLRIPVLLDPEESSATTENNSNEHTTTENTMDIEENIPDPPIGSGEDANNEGHDNVFSRFLHRLLGSAPDIPVYVFLAEYTPLDGLIEEFLRNDPNNYGPAPAAEEDIKKLQEIRFDPIYMRQEKGSMCCTICREEYQEGECLVRLPCKHDYHKDCVSTWLSKHNSCPMCRQAI